METDENSTRVDPTLLFPPFDCNTYEGPQMSLDQMLQALRRNRSFSKYIKKMLIASNQGGDAGEEAHQCLAKYYTPDSDELYELGLNGAEYKDPNDPEGKTLKCTDHSRLLETVAYRFT